MRSRKFGFLRHYRKIKIEGINLSHIVNKCIKNGIILKDLRWKNPLESTVEIQGDDFDRLKKAAGHSYKMTVLKEGGLLPLFHSMKASLLTIAGAFLLGALLFYQSLFVAEIRVDGYKSLSETSIRKTLAEAGLVEGARKEEDYSDVKAALYETYDEITWVSIFADGRLIKVHVAEAGKQETSADGEEKPVNIVAARSGMIEKILPLEGNARVQKGDYVNKGDVLISGKYKYQSTDYSRGDDFFIMYSHARGQALAKVPRQVTFYIEKNERKKTPTGKSVRGLFIRFGDVKIDTAKSLCKYEASVRQETVLFHAMRPLPITISTVKIEEVELAEAPQDAEKIEKILAAALRQYQKQTMKSGEEILSQTIDYEESENLIKANVFLEVLEDIGKEKKIKVKKQDQNKEETTEENTPS